MQTQKCEGQSTKMAYIHPKHTNKYPRFSNCVTPNSVSLANEVKAKVIQ